MGAPLRSWRVQGMKPRVLVPRAGPNGPLTNGTQASQAVPNPVSPPEMTVADLSPAASSEDYAGPLRKVPVPPRPPAPNSATNSAGLFGLKGNGTISQQAQQMFGQFLSASSSALVPANADTQLAETQAKLQQQMIELRKAKAELVEKNAEIEALKVQAIERESRLRIARSDLMEARAIAAEREAKVTELSFSLADVGAQRNKLREKLDQTEIELEETQEDLESLADEILAMKDFVLSDPDLAEIDTQLASRSNADSFRAELAEDCEEEVEALSGSIVDSTAAGTDDTWEVLQTLADMSKQLLEDAKMDEDNFLNGGFLKRLATGVQLPPQKKSDSWK